MSKKANALITLLAGLMLGLLPLLQGCPALIIVAIAYSGEDYATVTVEIPRSADVVFDHALKLSGEGVEAATGEPYTVEKIAKTNYFMRITANNGSWWLELNLVPLDSRSCQLIMTGKSPRITSYNVCYTKLLRDWRSSAFMGIPCGLKKTASGSPWTSRRIFLRPKPFSLNFCEPVFKTYSMPAEAEVKGKNERIV